MTVRASEIACMLCSEDAGIIWQSGSFSNISSFTVKSWQTHLTRHAQLVVLGITTATNQWDLVHCMWTGYQEMIHSLQRKSVMQMTSH